jgi:hypothetical protein
VGDKSGLFREELDRYRLCEREGREAHRGDGARCASSTSCQASADSGKMNAQIANTVNDVLEPQGVGVIIKATHHCMTTRGVHKPDTDLVTSRMWAAFATTR